MKELINFSEYPADLDRFSQDWEVVRSFTRSEGLDGIELLLGNEMPGTPIPQNLVMSVHLPGWFGWIRTWRESQTVPDVWDPFEIAGYYGAHDPGSLVLTFTQNLNRAASLGAAYAVFHISHLELEEFYTRSFRYTSYDVLESAASFLNVVCSQYPGGEPPVTLAFENLWWPGLTFRSETEVQYFTSLLHFDNWMFILDTGHLMNGMDVRDEQEGIQKVMTVLEHLSDETIARIRAVHLQCSTSGAYQQTHIRYHPPPSFSMMSYREKISELWRHIPHVDEHRPYSDCSCREILERVQPEYLVHEFITRSQEELREYIRIQKACIRDHF